jgi:Flp pilus assembly pilin Flp
VLSVSKVNVTATGALSAPRCGLNRTDFGWKGGKDLMQKFMKQFLRAEEGQDLVEYTLLLAFVCLASAALFIGAGKSMASIWQDTNIIVDNAGQVANGITAS